MKKLSLILLIITCCLPGFFASRLDAQVPNVTFTVQLSGEGARLGRVSLWQWLSGAPGPISLGECPFSLTEGQSVYPLLSTEQLSCTFTVPDNTFVFIEARASALYASDRDWSVKFSEFAGRCTGVGQFIEATGVYACEGVVSLDQSADTVVKFVTVSGNPELPTPTPTTTPTATATTDQQKINQDYIENESKGMKTTLNKLNLKNFAKGKALKLQLDPAPASGKLTVQLKVKIKKNSKISRSKGLVAASIARNPFSFLVIASGKASLSQGSSTNLVLRPTSKGKTYMKDKKKIPATLTTNFVPSGGGASVSQIQSILMRFR